MSLLGLRGNRILDLMGKKAHRRVRELGRSTLEVGGGEGGPEGGRSDVDPWSAPC